MPLACVQRAPLLRPSACTSTKSICHLGVNVHTSARGRAVSQARWVVSSSQSDNAVMDDAFRIATLRLQQLLDEASWDANEAVRAELATYSPAMKLTFLTNCGSLLTLMAFGVSWITGEDPLGGATMTSATVDAAVAGALAAIPLVLASLLTRSKPARTALPLLEDLHSAQATFLQPLLNGLTPTQLLIAASCTVLPTLFLLLPAMHGLSSFLSDIASTDVVQPAAVVGASGMTEAVTDAAVTAADIANEETAGPLAATMSMHWAEGVSHLSTAVEESLNENVVPPTAFQDSAASSNAITTWLRSLTMPSTHSAVLRQPALLPYGVADLTESVKDGVISLLEPTTAHVVRNVAREALGLLPAILSGFVAAYTVMRQLAPRRSQVWAIRDALMASDRYFRLTVSMNRGINKADTHGLEERCDVNSDKQVQVQMRLPPPADPRAIDTRVRPASCTMLGTAHDAESKAHGGAADSGVQSRLQLVEQLAAPPRAAFAATVAPSSAAKSAAISDAFRKVAILWLLTRRKVCQLAYMLTAMSIIYYAVLWEETNDLAAPATAAIISVVTELWLTQRESLAAVPRASVVDKTSGQ